MATTKIDWLKDRFKNIIIPKTLTKAVYDDEGKQLNVSINEIENEIGLLNDKVSEKADQSDMNTQEITGHISGPNPNITDSANAPIISNEIYGYVLQKTYSGYNLFEVTAVTNAYSGIEVGVIDKSVVTVRGTSTAEVDAFIGSCTLPAGEYIFSGCNRGDLTSIYLSFGDIVNVYNGEQTVTLTEETTFDVNIHVFANQTFANLVFYPMIRLASIGEAIFEPYVGEISSPNPLYPQRIAGLGDKGYFDGILLQGSYVADDGIYREDGTYICNKNRIPCAYGDLIELLYEENIRDIYLLFYASDGTYISSAYANDGDTGVNYISTTAPYNAAYVCFDIGDPISGFSLSLVKHICVRVNSKYIAEYITTGKNILDFNKYDFIHYHNISYSYDDDVVVFTPTSTDDPYLGEAIIEGETVANGKHVIDVRGTDTVTITVSNAEFTKNYYTPFDEFKRSLGYHTFISGEPITLPEGTVYINVRIGMQTGELKEYRTTIQIEKGSESTSYEKYHEIVASIPVSAPLYEGDFIKLNSDGSGKLVRVWGEITYDGVDRKFTGKSQSQNNTMYYDTTVPNCMRIPISTDVGELYCDRLPNRSYAATFDNSIIGISYGFSTDGELRFGFGLDSELTTLDLANEWLTENNIHVVYKLAEPTEEDLTSEQIAQLKKLCTFEGVTNISCDGETYILYFKNTDNGNTLGGMFKLLQNASYAN